MTPCTALWTCQSKAKRLNSNLNRKVLDLEGALLGHKHGCRHLCDAQLLVHAGSCGAPVVAVGGAGFGSAGLLHHGFDRCHVGCSVPEDRGQQGRGGSEREDQEWEKREREKREREKRKREEQEWEKREREKWKREDQERENQEWENPHGDWTGKESQL